MKKKWCKRAKKLLKRLQVSIFCLPLHPQSERNPERSRKGECPMWCEAMVQARLLKFLKKKVAEKFGSLKNTPYLCTRNLKEMMSCEFVASRSKDSRRSSLKKRSYLCTTFRFENVKAVFQMVL